MAAPSELPGAHHPNEAREGDEGFEDDAADFDLAPARKAVSSGVMTPDEAVKHWNMTAAEAKALGTGPGRGAREELAGEVKTLEALQTAVAPVLETATDKAAFEGEFNTMYAGLPETGQVALRAVLGGDVIEPSRPASEAQIATFASSDIGGELVQEWGRAAPKKLAMVPASIDQMIMRGGDLNSAFAWFDALPAEQAKAIVRSLAK